MPPPDPWDVAIENRGLAVVLAHKFAGLGLETADLVQEGLIALRRAWIEYDASRGVPYSAYARYHLMAGMRMAAYRSGRWVRRADAVPPADLAAPDPAEAMADDERRLVLAAVDALPGPQRHIDRERHLAETPREQRAVAEELGISPQHCCKLQRRAFAALADALGPRIDP